MISITDAVFFCLMPFSDVGGFYIDWLRVAVYRRYGVLLSYKQCRNALYRLRCASGFVVHLGRGYYAIV